jgi:hypothetical protein
MTADATTLLAPDEAQRLTEFARACKAAARAVLLYPAGHPAIAATLGRITQITSEEAQSGPLRLTVLPDSILLDDRALPRPEAAVTELASLLHNHLVGRLVVNPGGDMEAWRRFLVLLGRSPESVRGEGGIARVWTTMVGRHLELREIDYGEVLRERAGGDAAGWDAIVANCLQGGATDLDNAALRELLSVAGDADKLADLMNAVGRSIESTGGGVGARAAALLRLMRKIVDGLSKSEPDRVEPTLRNMASAVGQLTADMLMSLLTQRSDGSEGSDVMNAVVSRMSDGTIAQFVARDLGAGGTPTDRLAQVFQTLVRDGDERQRLLTLAKDEVAASPFGSTDGFEAAWDTVAQKLLTSYSDKPFVSEEYGRELSRARTQALEVEQASADPPERVGVWLSTVDASAVRSLDLSLVLDLLRIEDNEDRWGEMMPPVAGLIQDLLLVGDFDPAAQLIAVLAREAESGATTMRRQHAMIAIDLLVAGAMMRHIVTHLATIDEMQFQRVQAMCVSLGVVLVRPLAETLATEERPRTRERLTSILVAFGSVARKTIERLKASPNAVVRRTAIYLMREFGGSESLPDLKELLDDNEPQVQREAVRAILNIGTDSAYQILREALGSSTERSREAIMQSISLVRDERATPLFTYILRHVDHRGPLAAVYIRAIESLGVLKDSEGVAPINEALYKGEWWAPWRTSALRAAAAAALARIGTPEAMAALEEAAASRLRGVRAAARPHLAERDRRAAKRGSSA